MDEEYRVKRKVYDQGGSLLVAIPPLWARKVGIRAGSTVEIAFNGVVKILPPQDSTSL